MGGLAAPRRPQPVFEVAASLPQMKARVASIPVFTVANKENEFVLVSGEVRMYISLKSWLLQSCL